MSTKGFISSKNDLTLLQKWLSLDRLEDIVGFLK